MLKFLIFSVSWLCASVYIFKKNNDFLIYCQPDSPVFLLGDTADTEHSII